MTKTPKPRGRLGVWLFGARGGLATTLIVGARAIVRDKALNQGLLTETPTFRGISLQPLDGLVFGGHEVRRGTLFQAATEIYEHTGTIPYPLLQDLKADLARINKDIRPGTLVNAGKTITSLPGVDARMNGRPREALT